MKDIYIIIVTYNAMTWLKQCLDSCSGYNVIVIDNASIDETLQFISINYPDVIQLPQNENLGFGKANNIGISYALKHFSAEYVFLLNQDAYLVDNILEDLIETHENNPSYGILSPIHITGDKKRLDKKFAEYLRFEKKKKFVLEDVSNDQLKTIYDIPFVNAAGWLMSKECLLNVGGFDPIFFLYGEDDNLCQRILYHGFKIGVVSNTFVIHDRDARQSETILKISEKHMKIQLNTYKIKHGNINNKKALEELNHNIKYLRRQWLKGILYLNIKEARYAYRKYRLLAENKVQIINSYHLNKIRGSHYLSI